jgi:hypothetical protein
MQRKVVDSSSFLHPPIILPNASPSQPKQVTLSAQPTLSPISHHSPPIQFAAWEKPRPKLHHEAEITLNVPEQRTSRLKNFRDNLRQQLHKLGKPTPAQRAPTPTQTVSSPLPHHAVSRLASKETPQSEPCDEDWVIIATPEQETLRKLKTLHESLRQQLHQIRNTEGFFPPIWTDNSDIHIAIKEIQQENIALHALLTNVKALQALTATRDGLIQQLKTTPHYTPHFDDFLETWLRLSDAEVEVDRAIYYTQQVNTILRLPLENTTVHRLFMTLAIERKKQIPVNSALFVHSQAIYNLISLKLISLCLSHTFPPQHLHQVHYKMLINFGKELIMALTFMMGIATDPTVCELKEAQLWGTHSQLIVSILYQAQADLSLPFEILPLDELHDFPAAIIEHTLSQVYAEINDPLKLGPKFYQMAFWQNYLAAGYQQDPLVQNTPLEFVCKQIKEARQINPAHGKWCKQYPDDTPIMAREKALCALFTQGLQATMESTVGS